LHQLLDALLEVLRRASIVSGRDSSRNRAANAAGVLVVGIGSPHGDDRAGWRVADDVAAALRGAITTRKASVPHDLLDWCDGRGRLHLVDAFETRHEAERHRRFDLGVEAGDARPQIVLRPTPVGGIEAAEPPGIGGAEPVETRPRLRSGSTHHVDLLAVLGLLVLLGKFPDRVTLWAIPGREFLPGRSLSRRCREAATRCGEALSGELAAEFGIALA
jgi:hypothetical protein